MASSRSATRRPSARTNRSLHDSPGKWASASTISSPWPMRYSTASNRGLIKGDMPTSML